MNLRVITKCTYRIRAVSQSFQSLDFQHLSPRVVNIFCSRKKCVACKCKPLVQSTFETLYFRLLHLNKRNERHFYIVDKFTMCTSSTFTRYYRRIGQLSSAFSVKLDGKARAIFGKPVYW